MIECSICHREAVYVIRAVQITDRFAGLGDFGLCHVYPAAMAYACEVDNHLGALLQDDQQRPLASDGYYVGVL